MRYAVLLLVLAVLVVGCAKQAPPGTPGGPAPVVPVQDAGQVEATPSGTSTAPTGLDKTFGTVEKATPLDVDSVRCNKETRTITFRFKNIDTQGRSWDMDQTLGFGAPTTSTNVRVFVNSYEVNAKNQYTLNGVKQFGPHWPFSENCGSVKTLAPGSDVTCTLTPVPLKSATQLAQGLNEIFIDAPPSPEHKIQFTCE